MPWQRIKTALILLPLAIFAIFFLPLERFSALVAIIILIGCWEWTGFMGTLSSIWRVIYVLLSALLMGCIYKYSLPLEHWNAWIFPTEFVEIILLRDAALISLFLAFVWWMFALILVFSFPKFSRLLIDSKAVMALIGWLILIPTWVALTGLRSIDIYLDVFRGSQLLLLVLCLVWAADTGAFFAGKFLGRHKLAPGISPNKTWEGVLGGVLLSAIVIFAGVLLLAIPDDQLLKLILLASVIVIFSVIGDLTESIFKRLSGVKDSGQILPGHGGILDRIDSLTAATPLALLGFWVLGIS